MAIHADETLDTTTADDQQLLRRASKGSTDAFEELYRRHADASWRVACAVTGNPHDASDAVSEAFSRLMVAIGDGRVAPTIAFRPYLLVTTRNAALDILRRQKRVEPVDLDLTVLDHSPAPGPSEHVMGGTNASFMAAAFRDLPERWRSALWLTEVEGIPAREVGQRLGLSANGVSQLCVRARNGLRERYLQAHLATVSDSRCREIASQLGAYAVDGLSPRAVAKVDQHLAGCARCRARLAEVQDIDQGLLHAALPLPMVVGTSALAAFRSAMAGQHGARFGWLSGGEKTAQWTGRLVRPLASAASAVLAVGIVTAGVLGGAASPGGPAFGQAAAPPAPARDLASPIPASTSAAGPVASPPAGVLGHGPDSIAATAPTLPDASIGTAQPATPAKDTGTTPTPGGTSGSTLDPATVPSTSPTDSPPGSSSAAPPASPSPAQPATAGPGPLAQTDLAINLGVTSLSLSIGTGPGSCTGISVAGLPSCSPPPANGTGVSGNVLTPLGTTPLHS